MNTPCVGRDHVGILDGLLGAVRVDNLAFSALRLDALIRALQDLGVEVVALGRGDLKVDTETRVGHHHFVENVVRVADPSDR